MKFTRTLTWLAAIVLLLAPRVTLQAQDKSDQQRKNEEVAAAFQTVFYAVLEGCFADGLTDADVDQILRRDAPDEQPQHFIYACPICMATEEALQSYRGRANTHNKIGGKLTFGSGLSPGTHARLYSEDLKERLAALHDLEEGWVSRWVASRRLNPEELVRTQAQLKLAREQGLSVMQNLLRDGFGRVCVPGYREGDECALCNAAVGMKLKLIPEPDHSSNPP